MEMDPEVFFSMTPLTLTNTMLIPYLLMKLK